MKTYEDLNGSMSTLEAIKGMDLESLPVGFFCGFIKFLIAICKDYKRQVSNDISIITQLDKDFRRIADIYEILEATKKHNIVLREHADNLKENLKEAERDIRKVKKEKNKIKEDSDKDKIHLKLEFDSEIKAELARKELILTQKVKP